MSKVFTDPDGNFILTLPLDWEQYDDDEENTFAFFNAKSKSWTGNLRISPLYWTIQNDVEQNKSAKFIQDELIENAGAVKLKLGNYDCAHYKKNLEQDGDQLIIYYWLIGNNNTLFICSLTINKDQEQKMENKMVLETVQNIIKSIKIN